jgi:hypothetical protein
MTFRDDSTSGEIYTPAMQVQTQEQADAYLERLVERAMRLRKCTPERAVREERRGLAYWAGYFSDETRRRVERLYKTAHPVFGTIAPDPEQALAAGINHGNGRS